MALFSGDDFEVLIVGLTWPCTLPPGWSVEWDPSDVLYGLYRDVMCSLAIVFIYLPLNNEL